jgi:hypothetical protein
MSTVYTGGLVDRAREAATSGTTSGPWVIGAFLNNVGGWGIVLRRSTPGVVVKGRQLHAELYAMDLADQRTPGVILLSNSTAAVHLIDQWCRGEQVEIPHYGHGRALLGFADRVRDENRMTSAEVRAQHDPLVDGAIALAEFGASIKPRQLRKLDVLDEARRIAAAHPAKVAGGR